MAGPAVVVFGCGQLDEEGEEGDEEDEEEDEEGEGERDDRHDKGKVEPPRSLPRPRSFPRGLAGRPAARPANPRQPPAPAFRVAMTPDTQVTRPLPFGRPLAPLVLDHDNAASAGPVQSPRVAAAGGGGGGGGGGGPKPASPKLVAAALRAGGADLDLRGASMPSLFDDVAHHDVAKRQRSLRLEELEKTSGSGVGVDRLFDSDVRERSRAPHRQLRHFNSFWEPSRIDDHFS